MTDNLTAINELFERREHPRYADGYAYFCPDCGLECNVGEVSFDCQGGRILPVYIKCRYGCGRAWQLNIFPSSIMNIQWACGQCRCELLRRVERVGNEFVDVNTRWAWGIFLPSAHHWSRSYQEALNTKRYIMRHSERITIDQLTIKVKLEKKTMELFTIPVSRRQQEFSSKNPDQVRVLDNPQKDNLKNYVAWGRFWCPI